MAGTNTIAGIAPVSQMAWAVRDMDSAMAFWTRLGVGPFFVTEHLALQNRFYRGEPTDFDMSAAITYWGDTQIEIITQHDRAPSVFRDWLDRDASGMHHIGITVPSLSDAVAALEQAGGTQVHTHSVPGIAAAAYFEVPGEQTYVEVIEMSPDLHVAFARIKAIANAWDGSNPVRHGLPA